MIKKQKYQAFVGLLICYLGIIYVPAILKYFLPFDDDVLLKFLRISVFQILLCAGVLYYVVKVEKRKLSSIGFKKFRPVKDTLWGLLGFILGGISFGVTGYLVAIWGLDSTMEGVQKLMEYPMWFRIGCALLAGTTEEVLFRTYPIERLKEWSGSIWFAGLISIVLFAALHIPFWSMGGAFQIGIGSILWTLIYIKTRSIWPMIIMHVINDLFAFVALPMMFEIF